MGDLVGRCYTVPGVDVLDILLRALRSAAGGCYVAASSLHLCLGSAVLAELKLLAVLRLLEPPQLVSAVEVEGCSMLVPVVSW